MALRVTIPNDRTAYPLAVRHPDEFAHSFSHPDRRVTYLPMSPVMSAFGTKRTFASALQMSAFGGKADITCQGRLSSSTRRANSTGSTMAHAIMPIAARRPAASQYVNCCVETEVCEATSATTAPSKNMNVMVTGTSASRGKTERVIAAKTAVTTSEAANTMRGPVTAFCSAGVRDQFVR